MRVKVGFVALAMIAVVAVSMGCSSSVQQTNENEVPATLAADQPTIVLPPGVSCLEVIENAGSISDLTHGGDLVAGWEFDIKHNLGFADHGCEIVSSRDGHPTRTGLYSLRFEVREGDCNANEGWDDCSTDRSRHELTQISRNKDHQYEGDEYWYKWSILLPDKPLKTGNAISFVGQFNSDNAARFYMEDFSKGLGFRFNDETYKIIQQGVLVSNDQVRSQWTDILVHALWSSSDTGFLQIFINGDLKKTIFGPNMAGATAMYFDFGIYNAFISECKCKSMPNQVVYFDDIRRGLTRAEVEGS